LLIFFCRPVSDYSLVVSGRKIDPDAPLALLGPLLRDAAAILAPGIAAEPPAVSVPGYGIQAIKIVQPAPASSVASAAGGSDDFEAAAAGGAGIAVPAASVRTNKPVMFAFSERDKPPAIALSEGNTVATCKGAWSTVCLNHPGITQASARGKYIFAVKLLQVEQGAGVAIGVADANKFDFMQVRPPTQGRSRVNLYFYSLASFPYLSPAALTRRAARQLCLF
jgi:hypothetical protein